jgi:OOP family OmpA-OmpF porin
MYKLLAGTGASLILITGTAFGQNVERGGNRDRDNTEGLYIGAGLGDFSTEIEDIDDVDDVDLDFDEDESASKIFAGWRFNRFFAVQADYYDFGESDTALNLLDVSSDTKGFAPSIVGTLPLGPVELFARAGMIWYDLSITLDGEEVIDESGSDPVYSAGIGFTLFERLNLKAEYEVIDIGDFDDANAVWISANWRF